MSSPALSELNSANLVFGILSKTDENSKDCEESETRTVAAVPFWLEDHSMSEGRLNTKRVNDPCSPDLTDISAKTGFAINAVSSAIVLIMRRPVSKP